MKCFKKLVAATLITAMMATSFSFGGVAANNGEWKLNDAGEWNYWENGEVLKDQIFTINDKTYYVKEDGTMASDELIPINGNKIGYAHPDGRVATYWWVYLDDEGKQLPDLQNGNWYYFANEGIRLENTFQRIGGEYYAFDQDGKMLSEDFLEDGEKFYFEHDGRMARDKWLYIEGDWYRFKSDGSCYTAFDNKVASDSSASEGDYEFDEDGKLTSDNAPFGTIDSIEVKGDTDRNAEIGKEVKVTFDVNLASDSNATKAELTENHDFWLEEANSSKTYLRGWKTSRDSKKNTYSISYVPHEADTFQVIAVIDGVESDPVTITSDWGEENADKEKANAIKEILAVKIGNVHISGKVNSIRELCDISDSNGQIKRIWLEELDVLKDLDSSYAMFNRNKISINASEVVSLLGTGSLELVGGSLDAAPGEEITLEATKGASVVLSESFERQTSIELNLYKDDIDTSDLDIPVIVSVPIPKGMSSDGLKVFHMKEDGSSELLDIKVNGNKVSFVTDGFSNFVFAGKVAGSSIGTGGSGGGSGRGSSGGFTSGVKSGSANNVPETPGQWQQTEAGWQFKKPDGNLYQNTWVYAKGKWYWIESTGIMGQGWKELNGKKYYLLPAMGEMVIGWISDGENWFYTDGTGAMQTGWVNVNGKWYYLQADGHMLSATTTPDGYHVDANGAWIQ